MADMAAETLIQSRNFAGQSLSSRYLDIIITKRLGFALLVAAEGALSRVDPEALRRSPSMRRLEPSL
eukprot:6200313-Pleurochrysis_carterae.AAC.2